MKRCKNQMRNKKQVKMKTIINRNKNSKNYKIFSKETTPNSKKIEDYWNLTNINKTNCKMQLTLRKKHGEGMKRPLINNLIDF